jgi:uncharacterized protein (DUF58 family)
MHKTEEILRAVRQLELHTRHLVRSSFSGYYRSAFKGSGMHFDEVREYAPGDEIRTIDWNVTARMDMPYVKKFVEERELTVMLMVDVSASETFGSACLSKREFATEIASILAFSAAWNNDRVGLVLFSDRTELFIPPKKGRLHVLRLIREMLLLEPKGRCTDFSAAFKTLNHVIHRQAIVFVLSDFLISDLSKQFITASYRHDIIALFIVDPGEILLPNVGIITFEDAESGCQVEFNTSKKRAVEEFVRLESRRRSAQRKMLQNLGIDVVLFRSNEGVVPPLRTFFKQRKRKLL